MRFLALACDYDGTLATHGVIDPQTVDALRRYRASGRKLIMVTGRELPELSSICPHLPLFDRVVAENGGLLYRPTTGEKIPLGPPPDEQFLAVLRRANVARLSVGHVIVATWEPHETTVLGAIRDLGLELQVIFNKGAVMVLPSGINKATGLQVALKELGISAHNVAAIGDAENDHALLAACEAGAAVSNAVPMLKSHADVVTPSDHGAGVAEFIDRLIGDDLSDLESKLVRHHLLLGHDERGNEVRIAPHRQNLLIVGNSGSGKSTAASALIERLIDCNYQVCVIDPEGDYGDLEGAVVAGDAKQPPLADEVMKLIESMAESVVVNLLAIPQQDRPKFYMGLAGRLQELRGRVGRPHWIVVDEAHHVWPNTWAPAAGTIPERMDCSAFITLEPSRLPTAALSTIDLVLAVGDSSQAMMHQFAEAINIEPPEGSDAVLDRGSVLFWNLKGGTKATVVKVQPARGQRRRHVRKYATGELDPEQSFYFRGPQGKLKLRAQNLSVFLQMADGVDDETWLHHLRAGDYSRWITDHIKDSKLAGQIQQVEALPEVTAAESRAEIRGLIESHYVLPSTTAAAKSASPPA
jgi:hydroxymethylpyrimidine pyrophosphatase-like HAD family hydrolase